MRYLLAIVMLFGACGRIGFDPSAESGADAASVPRLLAYFPFDDDPTDGVDNHAIGSPNAVCDTTCPALVAGKKGSAYLFNGTTDAIRYPDLPELHTQAGTMALWVRFDGTPALDQFMVVASKAFGAGQENTWELFLATSAVLNFLGGGDSNTKAAYGVTLWTAANGTWVHVAVTWGSNVRLYIGGVRVDEVGNPGRAYDSGDVYLGSDFDGGALTAQLVGALDEVYLFSTELTAAEIAMLATP